jgi:hypothetical protein
MHGSWEDDETDWAAYYKAKFISLYKCYQEKYPNIYVDVTTSVKGFHALN